MSLQGLKLIQSHLQKTDRAIKLVAVTKSFDLTITQRLIQDGVEAIGENRVEAAEEKFPSLPAVEKHFIGRIQSKKIKRIVALFDVIQSVGSIEHLLKIDLAAQALNKKIEVFLQFNISAESQKEGFSSDQLEEVKDIISQLKTLHVIGVMGMASDTSDQDLIRTQFNDLRQLRDQLRKISSSIKELSMGMSSDYLIALEEGATVVRIGRALLD